MTLTLKKGRENEGKKLQKKENEEELLSGDTITKRELMRGRKGRIPHGMLGIILKLSAFSRIFKVFFFFFCLQAVR